MMFALGAASTALDAINSLTSSSSTSTQSTGFGENPFQLPGSTPASASPAATTGFSGGAQMSPATMNALIAAQSQSSAGSTTAAPSTRSGALQDLFSKIDANGDGQVSKSEFENALGAGGTNLAQADDVFNKLDTNGDGSVSLSEMSSALKGAGKGGHGHHHFAGLSQTADATGSSATGSSTGGSGASGSSSDSWMQSMQAASSTSVANSNGSTTTSLTFADGSSVSMTSAAASTSASAATSSYNLLEQLIQRQANAISLSANPLSFNA
jgi:EF-hand domain pair